MGLFDICVGNLSKVALVPRRGKGGGKMYIWSTWMWDMRYLCCGCSAMLGIKAYNGIHTTGVRSFIQDVSHRSARRLRQSKTRVSAAPGIET